MTLVFFLDPLTCFCFILYIINCLVMFLAFAHSYLFLCTECLVQRLRAGFYPDEWRLINAL